MRNLKILIVFLILSLFIPASTNAHVTVKPAEVGIGAFQTFTVSVPVEKEIPTVSVRLIIPEGVAHVTPTVKQGWSIEKITDGEGDSLKTTEIIWSGGQIPQGQRDEFSFSAQVPSSDTVLIWKAYQTYSDGAIVAWEKENEEDDHSEDDENTGPASKTVVFDDLQTENEVPVKDQSPLPLWISLLALGLSGYLFFTRRTQ
jgi:uncharacterized protein YcnI